MFRVINLKGFFTSLSVFFISTTLCCCTLRELANQPTTGDQSQNINPNNTKITHQSTSGDQSPAIHANKVDITYQGPVKSKESKKPEISSVMQMVTGFMVDVINPPASNVVMLVNDKDISALLESETHSVGDQSTLYSFRGSPAQLNLSVGKNRIVAKYGNIILPVYYLNYTTIQEQGAQQMQQQMQQMQRLQQLSQLQGQLAHATNAEQRQQLLQQMQQIAEQWRQHEIQRRPFLPF